MPKLKSVGLGLIACALCSTPGAASEYWRCDYASGAHPSMSFHVEGDRVIENSGDVTLDYKLLENSNTALVAAKGGGYASEPRVAGFLLLINKETGQMVASVASTSSVETWNRRDTGMCHRAQKAN